MHGIGTRRRVWTGAALAWIALFGLGAAASAGTGRLLSSWMSGAPRLDGALETAEWSAATCLDLGAGVSLCVGNDARTLYLGVLDSNNPTSGPGDFFVLNFDDEGGAPPTLDDGAYANPVCQGSATLGEGNLLFPSTASVEFQEVVAPFTGCGALAIPGRVGFVAALPAAGLTFEAAIPLDGPSPLRVGPGQRFGARLLVYRDGVNVACLPTCGSPLPSDFRNLVLASVGCNAAEQHLDSGLPLDWTNVLAEGGGQGWRPAGPSGDPVFCDQNDTGGTGSSACVSNFFYTAAESQSDLFVPIRVEGQATATLRFRGRLEQGAAFDSLLVQSRLRSGTIVSALTWQASHAAEAVEVTLDLSQPPYLGDPPVDLLFTHYTITAGGVEGGYAQVDDVELRCGPALFADGFESGLATHWSAQSP